jgi:hypothetical protein
VRLAPRAPHPIRAKNVHAAASQLAITSFFLSLCLDGGETVMLRSAARVALALRNGIERRQIAFKLRLPDSDRGVGNTVVQVHVFGNTIHAPLESGNAMTWCLSSRQGG